MRARADALARTREQILDAGMALWQERMTMSISLGEIAEQAGVTVRTLLRHFGSREGLLDALVEHARKEVISEREVPIGDVGAAVSTIVAHYEKWGDVVMRMLEESREGRRMAEVVEEGRRLHRLWVREVFELQLEVAADARALEDLLLVATDVYTWKLLRRDARLSRSRTEERIRMLIERLVEQER